VDNLRDRVVESLAGGTDTVEARVSGYRLGDSAENLILFGTTKTGTGNSLDNLITGNSVSNLLFGGDGNDTLAAAGSGANPGRGQKDTLTGGAGVDYFVLGDANGYFYNDGNATLSGGSDFAYITDFESSDFLVLNGSSANYTLVSGNTGVTGLSGAGYYGLFRELGVTDELVAVLRSSSDLTSNNPLGTAQFVTA
jgi:Ca2+-binding RTX toxin-like protein